MVIIICIYKKLYYFQNTFTNIILNKTPNLTVGSKNVNSFVIGFGAHLDDVSHEETDGRLTREQD